MIKQLKAFTVNLVAGANVATVILMLCAGYSDRLNPVDYPLLSCFGITFPIFLIVNLLFLGMDSRRGLSVGLLPTNHLHTHESEAGGFR